MLEYNLGYVGWEGYAWGEASGWDGNNGMQWNIYHGYEVYDGSGYFNTNSRGICVWEPEGEGMGDADGYGNTGGGYG